MKIAPRAVLFDSDGTLVDSERVFFETTRDVLERLAGVVVTAGQWARWYLSEGKNTLEIFRMLGIPPEQASSLRELRNRLFYEKVEAGVSVRPNVIETLQWLKARAKLAVVTSASRAHFDRVHKRTGLASFFDVIVTSDDCPVPKPEPDIYLLALKRLGLNAKQCIAVEDTPRGAHSARAAGLPCVIIPTTLTDRTLCPSDCEVISDIAELKLWFDETAEDAL